MLARSQLPHWAAGRRPARCRRSEFWEGVFDADEVSALLKKARVLELAITGLIANLEHSVPTNPTKALGPVARLADEIVDTLDHALAAALA